MVLLTFQLFCTHRVSAEAAGWLAPGVLVYFLDGILPLFRVSANMLSMQLCRLVKLLLLVS